jgi:hypothetical protein
MSTNELTARMIAPNPATKFVMRLDGVPLKDGSRPRDGHYFLRAFDADADDGQGKIELTGAIDRAQQFGSPVEVYNFWRNSILLQYQAEVLTSDGRALICRRCIEYVATGGVKEVYEYDPPAGYRESGERIYIDVEKARAILKSKPRAPRWEDKRENLLPHLLAHEIYEPHLPHVPSSRSSPGLLLRLHFTRLDTGAREELHVFASDLAAGAPFFFFALTHEESALVSSTNIFEVARASLLKSLVESLERREQLPVEFYDLSLANWRKAVEDREAKSDDDETRPTLTAVNRLLALRDAAYTILTVCAIDEDFRPCPELDEHTSERCRLCGAKGKTDES